MQDKDKPFELEMDAVGGVLTVRVTVLLLVHPFASVAITVYVVVDVGLAVTLAPVVVFNPVEGLQL